MKAPDTADEILEGGQSVLVTGEQRTAVSSMITGDVPLYRDIETKNWGDLQEMINDMEDGPVVATTENVREIDAALRTRFRVVET